MLLLILILSYVIIISHVILNESIHLLSIQQINYDRIRNLSYYRVQNINANTKLELHFLFLIWITAYINI